MTRNIFHKIYLFGFFIILFLPLLNLPPWFSPPDWGKTIVFRIIISILLFVFAYQIIFSKASQELKTKTVQLFKKNNETFPLIWLLAALSGIFLLSTIFSFDPAFSFWGSPYRSGGFLNFGLLIIFSILLFLVLEPKDWKRVLNFSIVIGIPVALIAIFQRLGYFGNIFIANEGRPGSTVGGPTFLAAYLQTLSFISLIFLTTEKKLLKKSFYLLSLILFLFVAINITLTRAVFFGIFIGALYFIIANPKKLPWLKYLAIFTIAITAATVIYVNITPKLPDIIAKHQFPAILASRIKLDKDIFENSRFSTWKLSLNALKSKPILGFGPENFSIAFDKYYNPSLPGIEDEPITHAAWWDRAHNFVFDISVTAGIPALIIYLALFIVLFWRLQRLKRSEKNADGNLNKALIYHGVQTTLIAYFVANIFSFDTFSPYLVLFLLVGYSLHLIYYSHLVGENLADVNKNKPRVLFKFRWPIITTLFLLLIFFIWQYNIKPFRINTQINIAQNLSQHKMYDPALRVLESQFNSHSILDHYLRLSYGEIIGEYIYENPEMAQALAEKARNALLESTKMDPYYTRGWLLAGTYTGILIESENDKTKREQLTQDAESYFEKAQELSPKRPEIFIEWARMEIASGNYQLAKEKAEACAKLNPDLGACYWWRGMANLYLLKNEKGKSDIELAGEKNYSIESKASLLQLIRYYGVKNDYKKLAEIYPKLVLLEPNSSQYRATLAFIYKEIGNYQKAREEALKVLELDPKNKDRVETFLKTLPY